MEAEFQHFIIAVVLLAVLSRTTCAAVDFAVTPSAVSNTYIGNITLQIAGLTNGETVVVQKYFDLNANGIIDGSDWLVQQFNLADRQAHRRFFNTKRNLTA